MTTDVILFGGSLLLSFILGLLVGLLHREKPMLPVVPVVSDNAERRKAEADQKALQDCMNYSIDVAYKTNGDGS